MTISFDKNSFYVQALATSLSKRLLDDPENSILFNIAPTGRQAKRNAQQINYSEDFVDDFEFEDSLASAGAKTTTNNNSLIASQQQLQNPLQNAQKFAPVKASPHIPELEDESKLIELSSKEDILIPIKLSLENPNSTHKLVDFFMWNINEPLITPTQFAEILCNDLDLPNSMQSQIAESINHQIEDYQFVNSLQFSPEIGPCVVIIELSVNLNKKLYQDKFEWDLNQSIVTPEMFSHIVVSDLGLPLEFKPAISHSLHEIVTKIKKDILEGSYNNEIHNLHLLRGLIFESGIRIATESSILSGNDHWEPMVEILTPAEIERRENEKIRNLRRLKRENMKRDYDDFGSKRRNVGRRRNDDHDSWR